MKDVLLPGSSRIAPKLHSCTADPVSAGQPLCSSLCSLPRRAAHPGGVLLAQVGTFWPSTLTLMPMVWKVCPSLETLHGQLNQLAPSRSRVSDGSIGDAAHATRSSDHNPHLYLRGMHWVSARDWTNDPRGGLDCTKLATSLISSRDSRIKYLIWDGRICAGAAGPSPWRWRSYSGTNPHRAHLHLSVVDGAGALDPRAWQLPDLAPGRDTTSYQLGTVGPGVLHLQQILNRWYPTLPQLTEDGTFGPKTEERVRYLQARAGLDADGVVGLKTRSVLGI